MTPQEPGGGELNRTKAFRMMMEGWMGCRNLEEALIMLAYKVVYILESVLHICMYLLARSTIRSPKAQKSDIILWLKYQKPAWNAFIPLLLCQPPECGLLCLSVCSLICVSPELVPFKRAPSETESRRKLGRSRLGLRQEYVVRPNSSRRCRSGSYLPFLRLFSLSPKDLKAELVSYEDVPVTHSWCFVFEASSWFITSVPVRGISQSKNMLSFLFWNKEGYIEIILK